jgi:hypothetical protein
MEKRVAPEKRARLTNFLIAKSIFEALFVGALAIGFYLTAFTPYFRGSLDYADREHIAGWVINHAAPQAHVEVQLYIDGRFAGNTVANISRPDVLAAGRAMDENHGFVFDTPVLSDGQHEARVYAVHVSGAGLLRTLQLVGKPMTFRIGVED